MFTACSDDDKITFGDLTVKDKGELTQKLGADEKTTSFTFSSEDDWTATVKEAATESRAGISWLSLNRYEGTPGKYTIIVTLLENNSGSDRKAVITVLTAGGDKFEVEVTQSGINKDGTVPPVTGTPGDVALVEKVTIKYTDNGSYDGTTTIDFAYDASQRVTQITYTDEDGDILQRFLLDYGTDKITVENHYDIDEKEYSVSRSYSAKPVKNKLTARRPSTRAEVYMQNNYTFDLNSSGYISSASLRDKDENFWGYDLKVSYDSQDYIKELDYKDVEGRYDLLVKCQWTDGNLTRVDTQEGSERYYSTAIYDNSYSNDKTNIDIDFLVIQAYEYMSIDFSEVMILLGFYGQRSRGLVTSSEEADPDGYSYGKQTYAYTADSNGRITGVKVVDSFPSHYEYVKEYTITYK